MTRIPTSMSDPEVARLVELAKDQTVLEVGTYLGHSAVAMAQVAKVVHTVDWHRGDPHAGDEETAHVYLDNLAAHGVRDKVVAHIGRSEVILPLFQRGIFDLAFIDAYHTTEAVSQDANLVLPLVHVHGIIAFHDWGDERFGVTAAVDTLLAENAVSWVDSVGSLAITRKL